MTAASARVWPNWRKIFDLPVVRRPVARIATDNGQRTTNNGRRTTDYGQEFMSNLLQEIEAQIAGLKTSVAKQNVGVVREIGDGVAKIEGLTDAMLNEMLDFGNGITGLALNLEETEVGAIILGDYTKIAEGSEVRT